MLDYTLFKSSIPEFISKSYSESAISKIRRKLFHYMELEEFSTQDLNNYFLEAIKSVCATHNLHDLKSAGCFNFSTKKNTVLFQLSDCLLYLQANLPLSSFDIQYLQNLSSAKILSEYESKLMASLKLALKQMAKSFDHYGEQYSLPLTICAYVEYLVADSSVRSIKDKTDQRFFIFVNPAYNNLEALEAYNILDIIDGASLIISVLDENNYLKHPGVLIHTDTIMSKRLNSLLITASKIRIIQDIINSNSIFAYRFIKEKDTLRITINDVNNDLILNNRLGYILRSISDSNTDVNPELPTSKTVINDAAKCLKLEPVENPSRFRLVIPQPLLSALCDVNQLTQEEDRSIRLELSELNLPLDITDVIYKNLTLLDYIQLHRLFDLFYYGQLIPLYEKYCKDEITKQQFFQSVIPQINKFVFYNAFPKYKEKLVSFAELCNYKETSSKILDLLYQPILSRQNTVYPLCSISMMANLGRNVIVLLKSLGKGVNEDGTQDRLIEYLDDTFTKINIIHTTDCGLGSISDIDFSFKIGNTIYIAECKNNFHPTDSFESRPTVDAIYKAERQLSRIYEGLLNNPQAGLFKKLDVVDPSCVQIVPFIITGNRILAGSNHFKYPVRYFAELVQFVTDGNINVGGNSIRTRSNGNITELDMLQYLSPHSLCSDFLKQSMVKSNRIITVGTKKIEYETYRLDPDSLDNYCIQKWNTHIILED